MKSPVHILAILGIGLLVVSCAQAAPTDTRTLQVSAASEKRVALVIGNGAYQQSPLRNPVNDARAMQARLKSLGFDVVLRENLKAREIGGVYREFRSKITPGGVALVFYAGHGVQFKGQNYFPAVDSDITSEEDVPLQSLNLGTLLDSMEEAKAGVSLVFLDACRDNPFAKRFRSASRGLAKVESASGTLIHYATKPGSVAADGDGKNGTYTEALLAYLSEAGVPVELMLKKVTNRVVDRTQGKQEPWVEGSLRGEFYFQGSSTINVQQAPVDPEAEAWQAAERVNTVVAYEAYLKDYPQGRYRTAARIALDDLKKPVGGTPPGRLKGDGVAAGTVLPQDAEAAFWSEVKQSGAREYLNAYLKQYPRGKYVALAKVELKKLDDQEREDKARAEQQAWESAKAEHSPAAYEGYLMQYPKGRYASLAEAARTKALRDGEAKRKQEAEHEWATVLKRARTDADVLKYLERHPNKVNELKASAGKGDTSAAGYLARLYFNGWGVVKDYAEGLVWARKAVERGNSDGQTILGTAFKEGLGVGKDEAEAVGWYRKAADQGNVRAQRFLAAMYLAGQGVAKNESEAAGWYRKAAGQDDVYAQTSLAQMYKEGRGVAKNEVEAAGWFRKAADLGHAPAQTWLGSMYKGGHGVAKDEVEAGRWYRKAADQGEVYAQTNLGQMYKEGSGVAKNEAEAVGWFRKAADLGHAPAQTWLGSMYKGGNGVAKDEVEAARWYHKAADKGEVYAQTNLGQMYTEGSGVAKNEAEAVVWFRKAADQGHAPAQTWMGSMHETGKGVAKDEAEAARWYRKAADKGEVYALTNLGVLYKEGRGVVKNEVAAVGWFRKAADQGHAPAQNHLGIMYQYGLGVARNTSEAEHWYRKAAEQGNTHAQTNLKRLYQN